MTTLLLVPNIENILMSASKKTSKNKSSSIHTLGCSAVMIDREAELSMLIWSHLQGLQRNATQWGLSLCLSLCICGNSTLGGFTAKGYWGLPVGGGVGFLDARRFYFLLHFSL